MKISKFTMKAILQILTCVSCVVARAGISVIGKNDIVNGNNGKEVETGITE